MRVTVHVTPRSSQNTVTKLADGSFKVRLMASPVDGQANKQLIELLSAVWQIRKSDIRIIHGAAGRRKIIEIP